MNNALYRISGYAVQKYGGGVGNEHLLPWCLSFHAGELHAEHDCRGSVLYLVVDTAFEVWKETVAHGAEMMVVVHLDKTSDNERHTDKCRLYPPFLEQTLAFVLCFC